MKAAQVLLILACACTEQVREAPATPREARFEYRVSVKEQNLLEMPGSSIVLARVPAGAIVAETGPAGSPWTQVAAGVTWINVAYRGDVGWLPLDQAESPVLLAARAGSFDPQGLWTDTQLCGGRPAYLRFEAGSFSGMRCEHCDLPGCPNGLSGSWSTEGNLVCLKERRGESACFFLWEQKLVAMPVRGFFWEYHGGAALSGLVRK